jgi:hypothetical protein
MRITLRIYDDVLSEVREIATSQNRTFGEVISSLARRALNPADSKRQIRNGVPLLPVREGSPRITSELVNQLDKELD